MTRHFVLHWMEQVRLYEELVDVSAALSDSVKLTLLTNAVRGHAKLSGVHTVAIQLASHFGQAVDFTKYSEMLLSECAQVDSALTHSARKSGQRSVYFTDLTIDDGEEDAHHQLSSADEVDYTIDSDPVTLMANAHKHREMSASCVLTHQDQWTGMQPEGQKIWDQLLGEDKAAILKKKPTSNPPKPLCTFYNQKPNSIMANAHQLDYGEQGTNKFGNYCKRQAAVAEDNFVGAVLDGALTVDSYVWYVNQVDLSKRQPEARHVKPGERDWETLRRFFSWASVESVEKTFQATMQMGRLSNAVHLKEHCHSPNPALNVHRHQEPIATDYVYADVPAVDDGSMGAQIFVGMDSEVCDAQGLKSPKQFVNLLEDNIQKCGAMDKLVSNQVQTEIGQREQDIFQALFISSWQCEPHQQQQNPAEHKYQMLRWYTNTKLSCTGAPANTWLLCLLYVCCLLDCLACQSLQWCTPLEALEGSTPDISPLLRFSFWDPVYYKLDDSDFPSGSTEGRGRWVGIAENVGHAMTYKILTDDTKKVIYRSNVRSALTKEDHNKRVDLLGGEEVAPNIKSSNDEDESPRKPMPIFDPTDLIGRTFLMDPQENGERYLTKILEALVKSEEQLAKHPDRIKFVCSVNDDMYEEILTYNEVLEYIAENEEQDDDQAIVWKFKRIAGHQGPLKKGNPGYNGSKFNAFLE